MADERTCHACGHSTRVHAWTGRRPCRVLDALARAHEARDGGRDR